MAVLSKKSQLERPVYCRDCYVPMEDWSINDAYHWHCPKCGREWKAPEGTDCPHCRSSDLYTEGKDPHIGLYCRSCGKWIKWIPQYN